MSIKRKREENTIALLVLLVAVLAVAASSIFYARIDMTQDRSFTLSKVSRQLHEDIEEQVRITYFVSDRLYKEQSNPRRIEDMLRSYAALSRGKIAVDVVDPDKDGQASAMAQYGIGSQQYQVVERNETSVANVYTGILIQYLDRSEAIPVAWDVSSLEYEITRAILKAVKNSSTVVEVLVGDSDKSWANDYKYLSGLMSQGGWQVREAKAGEEIGKDVDLLMVLGNSKLDDFDLYPVDQYLMRGGKAFFAVKGVDIMTNYGMYAVPVGSNALLDMLKGYGADIKKELVLDSACLTVPFQIQNEMGQASYAFIRYPFWISVNQKYVSSESPLTSKFGGLDLFWPSPMELLDVPGVSSEMIVRTSPKAWKATKDFQVNPQNEAMFYMEMQETGGQYGLAATLQGKLPSYFAGKKAPTREGQETAWKDPIESQSEARIVVISSADFVTDVLQYSKSGFNAEFATACAQWLGSDSSLLSIKTRSYRDNRLNKIQDAETQNALIFLSYAICLGLVPLAVAGYGVFRFVRRRRRAGQGMNKEALNEVSN